ncbi:MAG TPA: AsnC family transcriptional regulator [Methanomicrobia archaeon]|nr:AsnC family transcriptional regulator [Methanomicrobia archaeon]
MKLDEIDRKILSILKEDGRISLTELGEKIGMSHVGVKKRLDKLYDVIKVSPVINLEDLKFRVILVSIETQNYENQKEIIEKFKNCPRILFILKTTGEYNTLIGMIAENKDVEESIKGSCSIRTLERIRRSEVEIGELVYPQYVQSSIFGKSNSKKAPCGRKCSECLRYKEKKCLGCPATIYYRC